MDILTALEDRLSFIRQFYFTAAPPFKALLLEYIPRYDPNEESAVDELRNAKWKEAYKGRETLAHCCLSLVSKAVLDYMLHFVMREVGASAREEVPVRMKLANKNLKGNGAFEKYQHFLCEQTEFSWGASPVAREQIEQIILCRNDFLHDPNIDSNQPEQIHSRKYSNSRFIDPVEQAVQLAMTTLAKDPASAEALAELGDQAAPAEYLSLTATRELFPAISDARQFCAFVETKRTLPL